MFGVFGGIFGSPPAIVLTVPTERLCAEQVWRVIPIRCCAPRHQASHHITLARGVLLNDADPVEFEAWTKLDVDSLNLQASYNSMLGNHAAAEESAREAFAAAGRHAAKTHGRPMPSSEGLKALTSLREALTMMCRVDEAREIGWKALDHAEGVHGDTHPAVAAALSELVELAISETRIDDIFEDHKAGRINWRTAADALALREEDTRELYVDPTLPRAPTFVDQCLSVSVWRQCARLWLKLLASPLPPPTPFSFPPFSVLVLPWAVC